MSRRGRIALLVAAVALVAVVVIGLRQAPESKTPSASDSHPLDQAVVAEKLGGAPPPLAALHPPAHKLLPGAVGTPHAQLRAGKGHPALVHVWGAGGGPRLLQLAPLPEL